MNRKSRRAALKHSPVAPRPITSDPAAWLAEGRRQESEGRLDDAARNYQQVLALKPAHAEASNNLGRVLQALGRPREAAVHYARALTLMPQLFEQYTGVLGTLVALQPAIGEAMRKTAGIWPRRATLAELFGRDGLAPLASDPLLLCLLQASPVRELAFERMLTALRATLLTEAQNNAAFADDVLGLACALARQCFITEYVFATTPDEEAAIAALRATPAAALTASQLAVLAMYAPLAALPDADTLLPHARPPAFDAVLTQQIREPAQERALRETMPRLTTIDDTTSQHVRRQYEENPYPRWVYPAGAVEPVALDDYLRAQFPTIPFATLGKTENVDILVAGCGTGWQATSIAQKFLGAQVLAVDLSLASLSYAKRNTPTAIADRIDYAQADILALGTLDRRFDVIDASGVLHHMADWQQALRILTKRLRPGGFLHLGLYSEAARRSIVAARSVIAERGYGASADEIRRCRQELLDTPLRSLARYADFFTVSECRDLLFHVQETRVTIPQIKAAIAEQNLRFLGFEFAAAAQQHLRALFSQSGWSPTDLDRWDALEGQQPDMFSGMYQFWLQQR